jgi:steroid delta-isomerase-like uncharacterized protein
VSGDPEPATTSVVAADLRARREAIVWAHIRGERLGADLDAAIASFGDGEATYDVVPLEHLKPPGQTVTHPTSAAVRALLGDLVKAFPDLWLEPVTIHHADDAVIIEGRTQGTNLGEFMGRPPTGKRMDVRGCIIFRFDGDRMTNETIYMDTATQLRQLGFTSMEL